MAARSTYVCQDCNNQFDATVGNLMRSKEFRCGECDSIQYIPYEKAADLNHACGKCGGEMGVFSDPLCPQCKGRNVKSVKSLASID